MLPKGRAHSRYLRVRLAWAAITRSKATGFVQLEDENDGSTWVLFDSAEALMGSFGSDAARKIESSLDQKLIKLVEAAI